MTSHWDLALQKSLLNFKQQGLTSELWWEESRAYAKLVVDEMKVQQIFECKSNWAAVSTSMQEVAANSGVGKLLFQLAMRAFHFDEMEAKINQTLLQMVGNELAEVIVEDIRQPFLSSLPSDAQEGFSGCRREVEVLYRGIQTKVVASSPLSMFNVHVEALLRTEGVNLGLIPKLWCEGDLTTVQKRR